MRYLSLFSGIEAATVAWHPLGWECVGVSEIEPFPCAVLAHHYPDVPNLGDVTKITEEDVAALGPIDVVVFGSPCQDLSVAGHRKGLINADGTVTRSGLFFTAVNIFTWARKHCGARFALWENVPGAFSSNKGRDFGAVVGFLAGLDDVPVPAKGWGTEGIALGSNGLVEWATLDAQWFGVAQRRRRVFALLDTGDWSSRPPILLEPDSLRGNSAPSRSAGESVAASVIKGAAIGRKPEAGPQFGEHLADGSCYTLNCTEQHADVHADPVARCVTTGEAKRQDWETCNFVAFHPTQDPISSTDGSTHAMGCGSSQGCATIAVFQQSSMLGRGTIGYEDSGVAKPVKTQVDGQMLLRGMQVRRLTTKECERLQGFPDGYTRIQVRGKPAADGPRYKALGNSMAVPVVRWIGRQIDSAVTFSELW